MKNMICLLVSFFRMLIWKGAFFWYIIHKVVVIVLILKTRNAPIYQHTVVGIFVTLHPNMLNKTRLAICVIIHLIFCPQASSQKHQQTNSTFGGNFIINESFCLKQNVPPPQTLMIYALPCISKRHFSFLIHLPLTAHNWQKWKRVFLTCPCHEIYRVEAVGPKSSNYTWKIIIFCEYVKFWAISLKIDMLSITA